MDKQFDPLLLHYLQGRQVLYSLNYPFGRKSASYVIRFIEKTLLQIKNNKNILHGDLLQTTFMGSNLEKKWWEKRANN